MISNKQLFIKFLKENNAYGQYILNFNNREKYRNKVCPKNQFFSKTERKEYILCAFDLSKTIEGWSYWNKFHGKWINYTTAKKL